MKDECRLIAMTNISAKVYEAMIEDRVEELEAEDVAVSVLAPLKEMMDYCFGDDANEVIAFILERIDGINVPKEVTH